MRESCANFRAVCLICALQCLAAGDKGSPFSQWSIKTIFKHGPVVSGEQNCLGWDYSIVSAGGGRELVTVDWFGTPHRIREICSFCVHHDLRFSLYITLQFWGPSLCEVVFSQRDNHFRNYRGRVLSPHSHTQVTNRSGLREKVTLPCSGYMEYVLLWPGKWPWVCHFVKSLGPLQRASINRNPTSPQK